jgi:hypothetical protein
LKNEIKVGDLLMGIDKGPQESEIVIVSKIDYGEKGEERVWSVVLKPAKDSNDFMTAWANREYYSDYYRSLSNK